MQRITQHSLITYTSENLIKSVLLLHKSHIRHYAYALHDKDNAEPHTHILLVLNSKCARTRQQVCGWFKDEVTHQNTLAQEMISPESAFVYLTHSDEQSKNEGKYQYDNSIIKCDDVNFWTSPDEECDDCMTLIDDILAGMSFRSLAKKYGRDLIINFEKYLTFANRVYNQEFRPTENENENNNKE